MKLIKELLDYLNQKKHETFCMFDNMQKDSRLIINAECHYDPVEAVALLHSYNVCAPRLLRYLIKYHKRAPDHDQGGSCAFSYTRVVKIFYKKKRITIDLWNGDIKGFLKNKKFKEGHQEHKGFQFFNEHHTSHDLRFHRRLKITIPSVGDIVLATQTRHINLHLNSDLQKSLAPANSRGALVSELCAKEIPKLSTILPLQKGQGEIDYANKILEDRWLKDLNEFEKWKGNNPQQNTPDKWIQQGDGKGGKRKIPTEKPEKVKW